MHSRTLHRHLAESGTNFRALVDESRYEIARQMLDDTDRDVGQIACMLDYADTSAFARAFRRWSGTTPSGWRTRAQQASPLTGVAPDQA
jgi:AraC-like DNA-binding protein